MRRLIAIMLLVVLTVGAFSVVLVSAQDSTATPEPTADPNQPVTTIRILHLSPDGPTLVPYVNGAPSNIQLLTYPSSSGWVEVPGGSFALSLIPQGAAQSQAVVGPVTITRADSWSTIVVVGSAANGTIQAYNVRENVGAIPEGCARVTVFHAIEGAPAVNVVTDDGRVLASGLGFPGGERASGGEAPMISGCGQDLQVSAPTGTTEDSDSDTTDDSSETASTPEATRDNTEASFTLNPGTGALSCRALVANVVTTTDTTSDATTEAPSEATPVATEEAAEEATAEGSTDQTTTDTSGTSSSVRGQTFNNCGYTVDVPAGTFNLSVVGSQDSSTLLDLRGTALEADTYYFIAAVGTAGAPQVFTFSIAGERLSGLLAEDVTAEVSPVATEDVTAEATLEPTVEATTEPTQEATEEATEAPTVEPTVEATATVELTPEPSLTATP